MSRSMLLFFVLAVSASAGSICRQGFCRQDVAAEPSHHVPFLMAIKQRNLDVLEKTFWEVSDPKSANFRKYMTHSELSALTSNPKSTAAVIAFLLKNGVSDVVSKANGDFVQASAAIADVERLFSAKYHVYQHDTTERRIHRSLHHTVPAEIAEHVDFVAHVSDFPRVSGPIVSSKTRSNLEAKSDAIVTPSVILEAYGVSDNTGTNPLNSMSVFEVGQNYAPSDLALFLKTFDIPAETVAKVIGPNNASLCTLNPGYCGEASLDVQYIIGVANNVSLTYWAMQTNDTTPFYDWIVAVAADTRPPLVHSMSYGEIEQLQSPTLLQRTNTEFQKMGVRGLTIMISSGDDGAANYGARDNSAYCGFNPSFPASSPYVTAVGATQFKNGNISEGEIPCQHNNVPASLITTGGGFSSQFSQPLYQQLAVQEYLSSGVQLPPTSSNATQFPSPGFNVNGRGYPDVSALGHNYQVVIGGHIYSVDGTSCAAPVFAGMMALINDQLLNMGNPSLGFVNPSLYNLASMPGVFNDISTGNNRCTAELCCTSGFNGAPGWDPLSGLGTVNFDELATYLSV